MSTDPSSQDTVAIVFLAEASLVVAQEFCKKVTDYSTALIKRLHDNHLNSNIKIAFVSYGSADTAPSPILCKRFFVDRPIFFQEMMEDISRFGEGLTNSGGGKGMAALEGFVAALELIDIIQNYTPREGPNGLLFTSHIIHVAATSPDSSLHPLWNDTAALDNVDWDTLPLEIKKRNIHYTHVSLAPGLSRFQDLYASVVTGGSTPWFTVYNPHALLLAPFPPPLQSKGTPTKRAIEPPIERAPEAKRPRLQPNTDVPKPSPKPTTPQTQPAVPMSTHAQPIRPAPTAQQTMKHLASLSGGISGAQMQEKLKQNAMIITDLKAKVNAAKVAGDYKAAEELEKEYRVKSEQNAKLMQAVSMFVRQAQAQAQGQGQGQINNVQSQGQVFPQRESVPLPFGMAGGSSLSTGNVSSSSSNMAMVQDIPNPPQIQHVRSFSDSNNFPPMNPSAMPSPPNINMPPQNGGPAMTTQIFKMIEQQQRVRQQQQQQLQQQQQQLQPSPNVPPNPMLGSNPNPMHNIGPTTGMPNRLSMPPNMPMPPQMGGGGPSEAHAQGQQQGQQQTQPPQQPQQPPRRPVWQGPLVWNGVSQTEGKKNMRAYVVIYHMQGADPHENTWPTQITLAPTRETHVPDQELGMWMQRHKPSICQINPNPNVPEPERNLASFKSLIALLMDRKIYATATWTRPDAVQHRNVLFIPMNGGQRLVGAFFALTGLPEIPRSVPKPMPPMLNQQQMLAQMHTWSPEQRLAFSAMVRDRHSMQLAQQQQQQQPMNQSNNPGFPPNMQAQVPNNLMAAMFAARGVGQQMSMNAPQASVPATLPPRFGMNNNSVQNNFSEEIMQSFVQRTGDGGNNNMNL